MPTKQANPKEVNALPVTHPENFPVASFLCPPHLRPAIAAIYAFARAADDIADEGHEEAAQRLEALQSFRQELMHGPTAQGLKPEIFVPLHSVIQDFKLPVQYLNDLLKAFEQDVLATAQASQPQTMLDLLQYCELSANPVGRLLLHLYGVKDEAALRQSDAICSALQLINFWQDLSEDIPRGRFYVPQNLQAAMDASQLVQELCQHARALMMSGAPLVHQVPGRAGLELRGVVQGGLRILEKVEKLGPLAFQQRPTLKAWDLPVLFWRALWM
jgi:hydroxysqualene synthase